MSNVEDDFNEVTTPEDEFIQQYAGEPTRKTILPREDDLYPGVRGFRSNSVRCDEHDASHDFDLPDEDEDEPVELDEKFASLR